MKHFKMRMLPERQANLRKLADYLLALPEDYSHFDMSSFIDYSGTMAGGTSWISTTVTADLNECGTTACAVGHGPSAGIKPEGVSSWSQYADKYFTGGNSLLFEFLFGGDWCGYDNTPQGAGKRIKYFLQFGIPINGFDDEGDPEADITLWANRYY